MYQSFINNMQVYRGKKLPGFVDEDMLLNAHRLEPEKLNKTLSLIFATKYTKYISCIDLLTGGLGNKKEVTSPTYEWEIEVEDDKPVKILAAKTRNAEIKSSTAGIGENRSPIILTVQDHAFGPGAIIELDDKKYQLRIQKDLGSNSLGYEYECVVAVGDGSTTIPAWCLLPGCFVSRAGSAYEEYSDEADIISYTTGMKFRNSLSIKRLSASITGSAASDVLAYAYKDPESGKTSYLWADYQVWKAHRDFMYRRDYQTWTDQPLTTGGDGTVDLIGSNGYPVRRSAGIEAQLAPSNIMSYTNLTYETLDNFLVTLGYNVLNVEERKFMVFTGEMGMRLINDLLLKKMGALPTFMDNHFVTGEGQNLRLEGQFKRVVFPNGYECTFTILPFLDDPNHNRLLHPRSGKPLSSYTFYFIDTALRNGKSNIMKIVKKGRELLEWVVAGSTVPTGYSSTDVRSNSKDGYTINLFSEESQVILDPRGCGKLYIDYDPTS